MELQSEDFLLPEGFGLPGDSLALPPAPAQEPAKPRGASVYNIQANCSTEASSKHCKTHFVRQLYGTRSPSQSNLLAAKKLSSPMPGSHSCSTPCGTEAA